MRTGLLRNGRSLHTLLVSCLVAVLALLPSGLLTAAQGGPGMMTEMGGTVYCMGGWTLEPEDSSPKLVMHSAQDGSASFYLQHAPYTDAPTAVVTSLLAILGGTSTQVVDNGGVAYAGSTGEGRSNLVYHERTADWSSGYSLLILAKTGTLAGHLQSMQQNCVLDGVPLMNGQDPNAIASLVPGEGGAAAPSGQAPANTTTTTNTGQTSADTTTANTGQPAAGSPATFDVAGSYTLENGTQVAWSNYWTQSMDATSAFYTTLMAPTGFDNFFVQDYGSHMTLDQTWATTRDAFGQGGAATLLDEGQSPDGGYYGIWTINAPDGSLVYIMARAMYAPGTTTPTSTGFYAFDYLLDPMLLGIRQVSLNGQTAWADVDDNALRAIFQSGGPTGTALFTAPAPATSAQTTTTTNQTVPQTVPQTGQQETTGSTGGTWPQTSQQSTDGTTPQTGGTVPQGGSTGAGGQYTSPLYNYPVSWTGNWSEMTEIRQSDAANGYDTMALYAVQPATAIITVSGMNAQGWTPESAMNYWTSPEFLNSQPAGTRLILTRFDATRGGVILIGPAADDDPEIWITVMEATFVNAQVEIDVAFAAPAASVEAMYTDAQRSVTVNGAPALGLFTVQDILGAIPPG